MKTYAFEGYSDDTFGEYAVTNDDYDNCANGKPIEYLLRDTETGQGVVIRGQYDNPEGGWVVGVGTYDPCSEDSPIPDWPMRVLPSTRTPYSPRLEIDAPDSCELVCLTSERDKRKTA